MRRVKEGLKKGVLFASLLISVIGFMATLSCQHFHDFSTVGPDYDRPPRWEDSFGWHDQDYGA